MRILMTLALLVSLSSICFAGNKAEHEAWEKQLIEANRAKIEAAKALRKAERENHKKFKEAYEKARAVKHAGGHKKK